MDIIKRINVLLGFKEWSIHQLALKSDVLRSVLYCIMTHEVSHAYETIAKMCDGFGITVSDFSMKKRLKRTKCYYLIDIEV